MLRLFTSLLKTILLAAGALTTLALLLVAGTLLWLRHDPGNMELALEAGLGKYLGRQLEIGELLEARLGRDTYLVARDIHLANPEWSDEDDLASAGHLVLEINLPSLWQDGPVLIHELQLEQAQLNLLALADQPSSWDFWPERESSPSDDDAPFPVIISSGSVTGGVIRYRDPDQDVLSKIQSLQLEQGEGSELLGLDVTGTINDIPLTATGTAGPTRALFTGLGLTLDLQATWGELALSIAGKAADFRELQGLDLALTANSPRSRALLDLLGMPEVRDGPFEINATILAANPGLYIDAKGKLEEFHLQLTGSVDDPRALDGIDANFVVDGPSLAEAGAALEFNTLPDVPYIVSGKITRRGSRLELSDGFVQADTRDLYIEGVLPHFPEIDDWQVELEGKGINLALLGPLVGVEDIPDQAYDVSGALSSDENGVELMDLRLRSDSSSLLLNGIVGEAPDYRGTSLHINLAGNDMSDTAPWMGLKKLPAQNFQLQGEVSLGDTGWRLSNGQLQTPNLLVGLDGEMDRLLNASRVDAQLELSGPNLSQTLKAYGQDTDPDIALPFKFSGHIDGDPDHLQISSGRIRLGENTGHINGALGDLRSTERIDLAVDLAGPELRKLLPLDYPGKIGAAAYQASGKLHLKGKSLVLEQLEGSLPGDNIRLLGDLRVIHAAGGRKVEGRLRIEGDSSKRLEYLLDLDAGFEDRPFHLHADVTGRGSHFDLSPLELVVGKSDLSGAIALETTATPRFEAQLHSNYLHLPFLLPDLEELAAEEEAAGTADDSPDFTEALTSEERRERLIPDRPLPLDLLKKFEGRLRYTADSIYLKKNASSNANIELELNGGRLHSRTLEWDGTFSTGEARLSVDASGDTGTFEFWIDAQRLPILWLLAGEPDYQGNSMFRASIRSTGTTARELASSLNGAVLFRGEGGRMDNKGLDLIMGDLFEELFDLLNPASQASPYTDVVCNAGAVYARNGMLEAVPGFVMRASKYDYVAAGTIDLNSEALDMAFSTRSHKGLGISAGKAITRYIKLGGTLANPRLALDAKGVAISGSAAIATAGLSILADSMWDRWVASSGDPCKRLMKKARNDKKRDYRALLLNSRGKANPT